MPVFSIIVPIYNAEKYLLECLDKLIAQNTASDYEVILVDDGSTDRSGEICDDYVASHRNFRVVHQENGGLCVARNSGLAIAQGEYVFFHDSDDYCTKDALEVLTNAVEGHPDIVVFCSQEFNEHGFGMVSKPRIFPTGQSGPQYLQELFQMNCGPVPMAWSHIYRREFLLQNDLWFEPGLAASEDVDFTMKCLSVAQMVSSVDRQLYYYRYNETGLSKVCSPPKMKARQFVAEKWYNIYPITVSANAYMDVLLSNFSWGGVETVCSLISPRKDIMRQTSGIHRYAYVLTCLFGYKTGFKLFTMSRNFRRLLSGRELLTLSD